MEAARSSETSKPTYDPTYRNDPVNYHLIFLLAVKEICAQKPWEANKQDYTLE